jgi:hypothetical protein
MKTFSLFLLLGVLDTEGAFAQTQKFATHYALDSPAVPAAVRSENPGEPWTGTEAGPVPGLKLFAREKSGALWLGSTQGVARFDRGAAHRWDRWQYFFGQRWLADNDVQNIWVDDSARDRKVWVRTVTGVSLIEWRPMTLAEKAGYFDTRVEQRHVRHGMVASSNLRTVGDVASNQTISTDNDGLWTAMYLGAQAYRYAVTHDADARHKAKRSLDLLIRLEEITGIPGFPARSIVTRDEPPPGDGEWHATPDGRWSWKGQGWVSCVTCHDPASGAELARVKLPTRQITDCAFGGPAMRTLYVSSASWRMTPAQLEAEPLAGGLFAIPMDISGPAAALFGG